MANLCFTSYRIVGKKEEVNDLFAKIKQLDDMDKPLVENGFGNLWLGCLVTILGGNWKNIYCRGSIIDFSLNDNILSIETESAGNEMSEVRHFIEEVFPTLNIFYYEEESGCEIYQTNDHGKQFFSFRFILDNLDGDGPEYYDNTDSLLEDASEIFGKKLKTMVDLEEIVEESDCFSLHCVNVVND